MRCNTNRVQAWQAVLLFLTFFLVASGVTAQDDVGTGEITERHVMIPMRDGKHLSAWLYLPSADGSWPVVFEQRTDSPVH